MSSSLEGLTHSHFDPQRHFSTQKHRRRHFQHDSHHHKTDPPAHISTTPTTSVIFKIDHHEKNYSSQPIFSDSKTHDSTPHQFIHTQTSIRNEHSTSLKSQSSFRMNRRSIHLEHDSVQYDVRECCNSPLRHSTRSTQKIISWFTMQHLFPHDESTLVPSRTPFPHLRMITWNMHAPCYRTIKMPKENVEISDGFAHHSKPAQGRIIEAQCQQIYRDRMRRAFAMMRHLGRHEVPKMTLPTIVNEDYATMHSQGRDSETDTKDSSCKPQLPLDLIFLQEYWFSEDGVDRSWTHEGADAIITSDDPQESSPFFSSLLKEYLPDYEPHGVQRPNGKPDGVLMLFNTKSPHWELVGKRYMRLCSISTRVAVMLHLRTKKKYPVPVPEENGSSTPQHIHLLACNLHLTFRTDAFDEVYRIGQLTHIFSVMKEYEQLLQSQGVPKDCIYTLLSGDFNFGERLISSDLDKDQVLQYLLTTGFKAINPHTRLVSHLDHRSEEVPADFVFTKELVRIKECCLIPCDLTDNAWTPEWFAISDHRPLYCELEFCPSQSEHPINGENIHGEDWDSDSDDEPTAPLPG